MVNLRYPVKNLNSNKATGFRGNLHFPVWDDLTAGFTFYNDNKDTANGNAEKFARVYMVKLDIRILLFK